MYNKFVSTTKVIILLHFLKKVALTSCEDLDVESDAVNSNLYDSKNLVHRDGSTEVLAKLLMESKFNSDMLKNFGKNSDTVNRYEDITILDKNGQLKNLKYKSANRPKIAQNFKNMVQSQTEKVSDKVTGVNDKVTKVVDKETSSQVESPVAVNIDKDESKLDLAGHKSKFFDELGCK